MRIALGAVVVAVALAIVASVFWTRDIPAAGGAGSKVDPASAQPPKPSSEVVLSIAPGMRRATAAPADNRVTPLMREFIGSRNDKALLARLKALEKPNGEELYVMAAILDRCSKITGRKDPFDGKRWHLGGDDARARFADSLSPKAPNRDKRLAAFDAINYDECAGFDGMETPEKDLRALYERGAAAGDPKARVALLQMELQDQRRDAKGEIDWTKPLTISDSQLETWKQAVASGDPRALVDAIQLLGSNLSNMHLRGPDEAPIEMISIYLASMLAACDLGRACGPDSRPLQQVCAFEGHCDAADYRDYLLFYGSSPGTSQRVTDYQARLLDVIRRNDWSYFTFARGPAPGLAAFQRSGR